MRSLKLAKSGIVAAFSAATLLILAPNASANWQSYIDKWQEGDESRRWTDELYSEVRFKNCYGDSNTLNSATIQLYRVVDNSPDVGYDDKKFTNCFNYVEGCDCNLVSAGEWTGLPYSEATYDGDEYKGGYYFQLNTLTFPGFRSALNVEVVYQDATQAD